MVVNKTLPIFRRYGTSPLARKLDRDFAGDATQRVAKLEEWAMTL